MFCFYCCNSVYLSWMDIQYSKRVQITGARNKFTGHSHTPHSSNSYWALPHVRAYMGNYLKDLYAIGVQNKFTGSQNIFLNHRRQWPPNRIGGLYLGHPPYKFMIRIKILHSDIEILRKMVFNQKHISWCCNNHWTWIFSNG